MMSKGEYRVGINFNPSNDDMVGQIKRKAADLIDLIETVGMEGVAPGGVVRNPEVARLKALAQTHVEDAAMWAVKAATKPVPEETK
jgi:hypothetical protein